MYKYYLMILHIIRQEEIDMNRILVLVVIILIPIAIFTAPEAEESVSPEVLNISLDLPVENEQDEEVQVALSFNEDKSDAFVMDLEDYVVGVVAGEMPASFRMEALKAQGIEPTPENIQKASEQFKAANQGAVHVYNGSNSQYKGNEYLLMGATVTIPKFEM